MRTMRAVMRWPYRKAKSSGSNATEGVIILIFSEFGIKCAKVLPKTSCIEKWNLLYSFMKKRKYFCLEMGG